MAEVERHYSRRRELAAGAALVALLFVVYIRSPTGPLRDSRYALLTSEALLDRGSWDLAPHLPDRLRASSETTATAAAGPRLPYQLKRVDTRVVYLYPPGTPLLSLPFVAALRLAGLRVTDDAGRYASESERALQHLLAAALTACTALLLFRAARRELPMPASLAVALIAALGSNLWSTASRALWMHTWTVFLAAAVLLELLRWEDGERARPVLLGALLSAMFWVRPTNAVVAAACALFVAARYRRSLVPLLVTGALGLAAYGGYSWAVWSAPAPRYLHMARELGTGDFLRGLVQNTIDTKRGLLVASPILLSLFWALVRTGVPARRRPLAWLCGGVALALFGIYSKTAFRPQGTPGPRYLTDILPFLTLLGVFAWRAARDRRAVAPRSMRPRLAAAAALLLALASVAGQHYWVGRETHLRRGGAKDDPNDTGPTAGEKLAAWNWRALPQVGFVRELSAPDEAPRRRSRR